jgi:hypothetical protein
MPGTGAGHDGGRNRFLLVGNRSKRLGKIEEGASESSDHLNKTVAGKEA